LDKGLAMPDPRPAFGDEKAAQLRGEVQRLSALQAGRTSAGSQDVHWTLRAAQDSLDRHRAMQMGMSAVQLAEPQCARTVQDQARGDFAALVRSRRSVRQFDARPLPDGALQRAADLARHAPSVCNRSGARVWFATDAPMRQHLLRHQDGHQGFADRASAIALITVDTAVFHTVGERHQGWVDGGLFAMTFVHALHFEGLGTCCLNWSVEPAVDRALKRDLGLPFAEAVIMMVAIGGLPEHYTVAHSPRRPIEEVLISLDERLPAAMPSIGRPVT
jgi:nitroreductase